MPIHRASVGFLLMSLTAAALAEEPPLPPFRAPAVPLVTHDPYFSVWSCADRLTDDWSKHWTGTTQALCLLARIDDRPFRLAGRPAGDVPPLPQTALDIAATRTTYRFAGEGVEIAVEFCSPLLPHRPDVLARPVSYLTWSVRSLDEKPHRVALYADLSGEWCVNSADQLVNASRFQVEDLTVLRIGTVEQAILAKRGDNLRIDWGQLYVAAPQTGAATSAIAGHAAARDAFVTRGSAPSRDDTRFPRAANDDWPVLAFAFELGAVGADSQTLHLLIAYDDLFSIEHFHRRLRPYWRRDGAEAADLLAAAERDCAELRSACERFDHDVFADLQAIGGEKYARLATLAYRQCLAAHKLAADWDKAPLMFSKENFSNGCIGTVDVIYPAAPFFLVFNPDLLKAQLTPVLDYAASDRWPHPFAPHDLGTYPQANGQVYGGGERSVENQMPVEESGNMLLLLAALAQADGNADYARRWWPTVSRWAEYLAEKGLDPENQLCTDDFAGHLAHNANLSLKAILALGAYGQISARLGDRTLAERYRKLSHDMAAKWQELAADGDHYKLAFDRAGTWSQKYNLVWDRLLGLELFPAEIARREIAYYKTKLNPFGLPLDNRKTYAKTDWTAWTATLAESKADFAALVDPLYDFANATPQRVPLTDWYETTDARHVGFQARSVIGGVFMPLLADAQAVEKWRTRARPEPRSSARD